MLIFGIKLLIQNVYPFEHSIIAPFMQHESWILVHTFIPLLVGMLTKNVYYTILICYAWESFEVLCGFPSALKNKGNLVNFISNWTGHELPSDSQILDILQGSIAAIWAVYLMKRSKIDNGIFWRVASKKRKALYCIMIVFMGLSALISIIQFQVTEDAPLYSNTFKEFKTNPMNLIPVGMVIWAIVQIAFLYMFEFIWKSDSQAKWKVSALADDILTYFLVHAITSVPSFIPTFYSYWLTTPFLIILFSLKPSINKEE